MIPLQVVSILGPFDTESVTDFKNENALSNARVERLSLAVPTKLCYGLLSKRAA